MFAMHQSDLIKYSDEHIEPARRKSPSDETKKRTKQATAIWSEEKLLHVTSIAHTHTHRTTSFSKIIVEKNTIIGWQNFIALSSGIAFKATSYCGLMSMSIC